MLITISAPGRGWIGKWQLILNPVVLWPCCCASDGNFDGAFLALRWAEQVESKKDKRKAESKKHNKLSIRLDSCKVGN
jgi:hypothetical protein